MLLETLKSLGERQGSNPLTIYNAYISTECLLCIRAMMESEIALEFIVENSDYTQKLATGKSSSIVDLTLSGWRWICMYMARGSTLMNTAWNPWIRELFLYNSGS